VPLFNIDADNRVQRFRATAYELEKTLQQIIQQNLEEIFGVHLVASEFSVRGEQPGRIDTLGLDHEGAPTVIEYKRDKNDSVINQGLYYINWLLEHRGDFVVAAREALGNNIDVNWSHPRLIIIAQNYVHWDTYAVKRMGEGIELWEYMRYGDNLLYLNQVYGQQRSVIAKPSAVVPLKETDAVDTLPEAIYTLEDHLNGKPEAIKQMFAQLQQGVLALAAQGEIIETPNKLYVSYRHGKNFCEVQVMTRALKLHLDISAQYLNDPERMSRDVSSVGHWGTGDIEVRITDPNEIEYVLNLIEQSYRMTL